MSVPLSSTGLVHEHGGRVEDDPRALLVQHHLRQLPAFGAWGSDTIKFTLMHRVRPPTRNLYQVQWPCSLVNLCCLTRPRSCFKGPEGPHEHGGRVEDLYIYISIYLSIYIYMYIYIYITPARCLSSITSDSCQGVRFRRWDLSVIRVEGSGLRI